MPSVVFYNENKQSVSFACENVHFAGGVACEPVDLFVEKGGILMKSKLMGFVQHKTTHHGHPGLVVIPNIIEYSPNNIDWFTANKDIKVQGVLMSGSTYIILDMWGMPLEVRNTQFPNYY